MAQDLDEDGLEDSLEYQLLQQFAPYYRFHTGEDTRPAGVRWFTQRSRLWYWEGAVPDLIVDRPELEANPLAILNQAYESRDRAVYSSFTDSPYETDFLLLLVDQDRDGHGQPWADFDAQRNIGLYGHVVTNPSNADELIVQYWQFFAFSDDQGPFGGGNHQGDWLYLDIYVHRKDHDLIRMVYHHHGDENCAPTVLPNDYPLPPDGRPVCYLEEGTHEWWPFASDGGECDWGLWWNDGHDGEGPAYQTANIRNLGEAFAQMPDADGTNRLVLHFNGAWGDPAGPPPRGAAWPRPALFVAYVDLGAGAWSAEGLGSRYHPYRSVGAGYTAVQAGGRIRIAPGSYPGAYTIDKAVTLEVHGGGVVTIGQ
jgi:hypothetical protein